MVTEKIGGPFVPQLIEVANRIRAGRKLPRSHDPVDAALIVSIEILLKAVPVESLLAAPNSIRLAGNLGAFTCLVVSSILTKSAGEGCEMPNNRVLASVGLALYQMHEKRTISGLLVEGLKRYTWLVEASAGSETIREFISKVNRVVLGYIMSEDENLIDVLASLYKGLSVTEEN
jgi:hypothetical protein